MKDVEDLSDFDTKKTKTKKDKNKDNDEEDEPLTTKAVVKEIVSVIINVLICFFVVFLITHFVGQRTVVSGSSMEDTLSDGDNLIVDKISYRIHDPERFDVVVFPYKYEEDTYYIKRIIGLPGENVRIDSAGVIYINGEAIEDKYGTEEILNAGLASTEILLGPGEYFVLGDNRNNSTDSRFEQVGNVMGDDIVGKAWLRVYPFGEFGLVDNIE
ncbi:MAG: signal peptidase I [Pseudobutyrivibrio sp.]|nr:signal peptidase I [Pseudobutyrivibrio sp.]